MELKAVELMENMAEREKMIVYEDDDCLIEHGSAEDGSSVFWTIDKNAGCITTLPVAKLIRSIETSSLRSLWEEHTYRQKTIMALQSPPSHCTLARSLAR